ncbi:MAG: hypothetical protein C0504_02875 [Candidatus Solibacter sp.]|nr:hypothetical protein [Candidatus Solibacter sp.]
MRVEAEVEARGGRVRVVLRGGDEARVWGKFVVGRLRSDPGKRVLVFDTASVFHRDIAAAYGVQAGGGGWLEIDHGKRTVVVGGTSTQFGREPDRGLTVALLEEALPGYMVEWR